MQDVIHTPQNPSKIMIIESFIIFVSFNRAVFIWGGKNNIIF